MTNNNGKFVPEPKKSGDPLRSADWNAAMQEIVRLETAKINREGAESLQGPLTIAEALTVSAIAPPTSTPLEIRGTLKLAEGVAVNQFSADESLGENSDSILPTQKAVKTYVDAAVQGSETKDFQGKNLRIYGNLIVDGTLQAKTIGETEALTVSSITPSVNTPLEVKGALKLAQGVAINQFSADESLGENSDSIIPTQKAVKTYIDTAVKNSVDTGNQSAVVRGMIMMWSGQAEEIPTGWALCDGQNGTPDLRDRFIVAAGNTYNAGQLGGSRTHKHSASVSVQGHRLTIEQIPSHSHRLSDLDRSGNPDGWKDGGRHYWRNASYQNLYDQGKDTDSSGGNQEHSHNAMVNIDEIIYEPPYYALAFIMKL